MADPVADEFARHAAEFDGVIRAIREHGADLLKISGVVAIRPSFRFRDDEITGEPVIQVLVQPHEATDTALVPDEVGGVPVDVVEASLPHVRRFEEDQLAGPGRFNWRMSTTVPGGASEDEPGALDGPLLPYPKLPEPLTVVDEEMSVICHSSCDGGWSVLQDFFEGTKVRLRSTMYEFTADYILTKLLGSLGKKETFRFVFDGKRKKRSARDLTQEDVVTRLRSALNSRLDFAWAANRQARQVTGGYFPSAYHIKVSVSDGKRVWLSSGNWKHSGQPAVDPFDPPGGFNPSEFQDDHNREWHVVIDNANLANQFESVIDHDYKSALKVQDDLAGPSPIPPPEPDVLIPLAAAPAPKFFPPITVTGRIRVEPLLTPDSDSYFDAASALISSARKSLLFENQSLSPKETDPTYMKSLFLALRDKSHETDMDVRIIVRGDYDPAEILAKLKLWKFNMGRVRLLEGCHTKGIIVDDEALLLGSHNWTGDGTLRNRDASLIFRDPRIIAFYKELFEYDWGRSDAGTKSFKGRRLARPGAATPKGFKRKPWSAVYEED